MEERALNLGLEYYLNNIRSIDMDIPIEGLTILSKTDVVEYSHIIKDIINRNKKIFFWCKDYEIAKMIEELLPPGGNYQIGIIDDFKNIDRSYIKESDFKKSKLIIPFPYLMWGVDFDKEITTSHDITKPSFNGGIGAMEMEVVSKDTVIEAERIASMVAQEDLSEIEKILIIYNYVQAHTQFVDGKITKSKSGDYVIPDEEDVKDYNERSIGTVLLKNYGVCASIANAMVPLLNNPYLNIDIRTTRYADHAWNIVRLSNGKCYYVDATWNISRSDNKFENALKAKSFYSKHILFGIKTAREIGKHNENELLENPYNISYEDFDRNYLAAEIEYLEGIGLLKTVYPDSFLTFNTSLKK